MEGLGSGGRAESTNDVLHNCTRGAELVSSAGIETVTAPGAVKSLIAVSLEPSESESAIAVLSFSDEVFDVADAEETRSGVLDFLLAASLICRQEIQISRIIILICILQHYSRQNKKYTVYSKWFCYENTVLPLNTKTP